MEDWKGNKIVVGQTAVVVNVKSIFGGSKSKMMINDGKKWMQVGDEITFPEGYQWTVHSEYIIKEPSNNVTLSTGDAPSEIPINQIDFWLTVQPWQILCIKDVSDNYEDYFNALFKV